MSKLFHQNEMNILAFREESKIAFLAINYYFVFSCLPQRWRVIIRVCVISHRSNGDCIQSNCDDSVPFCVRDDVTPSTSHCTCVDDDYHSMTRCTQLEICVWSCVPCVQFLVVRLHQELKTQHTNQFPIPLSPQQNTTKA